MLPSPTRGTLERRSITVRGRVQGVGYRPFVHRLAESLGVAGFVRNHAGEVQIEAEGSRECLGRFVEGLATAAPPLARVDAVGASVRGALGELGFRILPSTGAAESALVLPDVATCAECVRELLEPTNRRYRYPFIACTDCGPRLTIAEPGPYDRERTSMRRFALCGACRAEYDDPRSRRFHAQATACATCGPTLSFDGGSATATGADALDAAVRALGAGQILAVKGLGGYHLACLAGSEDAVTRLRQRKERDDKPLAVMVQGVAEAEALVELSHSARALLGDPARPIVLAPRRAGAPVAAAVAPGSPWLGVMLAYTPVHHLLLAALEQPLVMTSANLSHEPIAFEDADARARLGSVADAFLAHDRAITTRCDDSVVRPLGAGHVVLRRARGYAPEPLVLERPLPCRLLALGAETNAAFALGRERHVFVSHHLGDLAHYAAYEAFLLAKVRYERLLGVTPEAVVHDLHPDYRTSELARLAQKDGLRTIAVQHHHAHIASVMLEHGLEGPVLGVAFDGTGLGADGTLWGGELLLADRASAERVGYLWPVPVPGGDRAVLEPWRMALAYLVEAGEPLPAFAEVERTRVQAVADLLQKPRVAPRSSSAGRLFDAVSALLGVCQAARYDAQPAIELEWAALRAAPSAERYEFALERAAPGRPEPAGLSAPPGAAAAGSSARPWVIDTRPLVRDIARDARRGVPRETVARRFHLTLAAAVVAACERVRAERGVTTVALGGGVFANGLLVETLVRGLGERGFAVHRAERFPPGDGGLCLGQLAVAAERLSRGREAA